MTSMILKLFSTLDANVCKIKVLPNFKILCPVFLFTLHHSTFTLIDLLQNYKEPVRKSQEASQESQQNDAHWIHFFWGGMKNVLKRLKLILLCGGMLWWEWVYCQKIFLK